MRILTCDICNKSVDYFNDHSLPHETGFVDICDECGPKVEAIRLEVWVDHSKEYPKKLVKALQEAFKK